MERFGDVEVPGSGGGNEISELTSVLFKHRAKERFDRWLRDYPRATPTAVFTIAMALVLMAAWSVELAEKRIWLAGQQGSADDIASSLERQAASDAAFLDALAAVFSNAATPSPQSFRTYVDRLHVLGNMQGIAGIGLVQTVDGAALPQLRAGMAADGVPRFQPSSLRPAGQMARARHDRA